MHTGCTLLQYADHGLFGVYCYKLCFTPSRDAEGRGHRRPRLPRGGVSAAAATVYLSARTSCSPLQRLSLRSCSCSASLNFPLSTAEALGHLTGSSPPTFSFKTKRKPLKAAVTFRGGRLPILPGEPGDRGPQTRGTERAPAWVWPLRVPRLILLELAAADTRPPP